MRAGTNHRFGRIAATTFATIALGIGSLTVAGPVFAATNAKQPIPTPNYLPVDPFHSLDGRLSNDGKYALRTDIATGTTYRDNLLDGTSVALDGTEFFTLTLSGDGETVIGHVYGGGDATGGVNNVRRWKPSASGAFQNLGPANYIEAGNAISHINEDGTVLLSEYRDNGNVTYSRIVDLKFSPPKVTPIANFTGKLAATAAPIAAEVFGTHVVMLTADSAKPNVIRYRAVNVRTNAVVSDGALPFTCGSGSALHLNGAAAYCTTPNTTSVPTFNIVTKKASRINLDVNRLVGVTINGDRAVALSGDANAPTANLTLYTATGTAKVLDTNVVRGSMGDANGNVIYFDVLETVSTSASGTAVVFMTRTSDSTSQWVVAL